MIRAFVFEAWKKKYDDEHPPNRRSLASEAVFIIIAAFILTNKDKAKTKSSLQNAKNKTATSQFWEQMNDLFAECKSPKCVQQEKDHHYRGMASSFTDTDIDTVVENFATIVSEFESTRKFNVARDAYSQCPNKEDNNTSLREKIEQQVVEYPDEPSPQKTLKTYVKVIRNGAIKKLKLSSLSFDSSTDVSEKRPTFAMNQKQDICFVFRTSI